MKRRRLLRTSGALAALGGLTTVPARGVSPDTGGGDNDGDNDDILLSVFLRGGADGLHIMPPLDGPDRALYERYRPSLKIPTGGAGAALPVGTLAGVPFGLHPAAAPLKDLYDDGLLALVQGVGMPDSSRSHFDAMAYAELGTPGALATPTGWLTRHLASADNLPARITLPALAIGRTPPASLLGSRETVTLQNPSAFGLGYSHWKWHDPGKAMPDRDSTLRRLYAEATGVLGDAGSQALTAAAIIGGLDFSSPSNYPDHPFGRALDGVARLLKQDLGVRIATVGFGAWDTHANQDSGGYFGRELLGPLAQGLAVLFDDLAGFPAIVDRLTVVVQSEFGRRVYQNGDAGTDHGTGNIMMVIGKTVFGGRLYGHWAGLAEDQLFAGEDLAYGVDFRQVLAEIVQQRLQNDDLAAVFPEFQPSAPLGLIRPRPASKDRESAIFRSDFG